MQPVGGKKGREKWDDLSYGILRPLKVVRAKVNSLYGFLYQPDMCKEPITKKSRFSKVEDELLVDAVNKMAFSTNDGPFDEGLVNWQIVALHVVTRTAAACKQRWKLYFWGQETDANRQKPWRYKDVYTLCKIVCNFVEENNVGCFRDIPWETIKTAEECPKPAHQMEKIFRCFMNNSDVKCSQPSIFLKKVSEIKDRLPLSVISLTVSRWKDVK